MWGCRGASAPLDDGAALVKGQHRKRGRGATSHSESACWLPRSRLSWDEGFPCDVPGVTDTEVGSPLVIGSQQPELAAATVATDCSGTLPSASMAATPRVACSFNSSSCPSCPATSYPISSPSRSSLASASSSLVAFPEVVVAGRKEHKRFRTQLLATSGLQIAGSTSDPLVPEGIGPDKFLKVMRTIQHPMELPPVVPEDVMSALTSQGPGGIELIKRRLSLCMLVKEWSLELGQEREQWANSLHPDVRAVIGHLHGPLLDKLLRLVNHKDVDYMSSLSSGRRALGKIAPAGIFRPVDRRAQIPLAEWIRQAPKRNKQLVAAMTSTGDADLDWAAWQKREKEIEIGAVQGPFRLGEVDLDIVAVHPSFPVWERSARGDWKARNIENLKASGGNNTVECVEAYVPHDLDVARSVLRAASNLWGPEVQLAGFTSDYRGAFRQCPIHPDQVDLMWSLTWHPGWREPVLLRNRGQVFGGAGSQFNYVRDPAAMCSIMRSLFCVAMLHYSDDAWCFEREDTVLSAWFCWVWLNKLIGWVLDMDKTPFPALEVRLLGALLCLQIPRPFASLPADKVSSLISDIDGVLAKRFLSGASAASLRGRLGWARTCLFGRYGSAALAPLRDRQYFDQGVGITPAIEAALQFFRRLLADQPQREMPLSHDFRNFVVTVSDGEGSGSVAVGIWLPRVSHFQPQVTRVDVPDEWHHVWGRGGARSNVIQEIEGIGPLLALATWPEILQDSLWVHFLDNESAKFSLIRGSSRATSMNQIVHRTWEICRSRRLYPWWERVCTKDNPIDQASRRNLTDLYKQHWRVVPPTLPEL